MRPASCVGLYIRNGNARFFDANFGEFGVGSPLMGITWAFRYHIPRHFGVGPSENDAVHFSGAPRDAVWLHKTSAM